MRARGRVRPGSRGKQALDAIAIPSAGPRDSELAYLVISLIKPLSPSSVRSTSTAFAHRADLRSHLDSKASRESI
jgi:hypothetical protein